MGYTPHCIGYRYHEHGCDEYRATGKMPPYFVSGVNQYVDPTTIPADEKERLLNWYYSSEGQEACKNTGCDGTINVNHFRKEELKKN